MNHVKTTSGEVTNFSIPKEYQALLTTWTYQPYTEVAIDYDRLLKGNPAMASILNLGPCIFWIMDLRTLTFDFISSNATEISGYEVQEFKDKGLDFLNEITHPNDLLPAWKLRKKIWDFLNSQPAAKRKSYRFTSDFRLTKPDGSHIRILEQNSVLQLDSQGTITHVMGICSDITNLKKSEALTASVFSTEDNSCFFFTPDDNSFNPQEVLSKRELEIVKLIAEGFSSKAIADKLCIGFNTVNTHRQNIIRKTNTHNTGEFIQFAMCHGLI